MNVSYRRLRFCRVGYAVFVISDNTESVARRGNEVLIRNGVFLNGTSFCTSLRFPFVFIYKKSNKRFFMFICYRDINIFFLV